MVLFIIMLFIIPSLFKAEEDLFYYNFNNDVIKEYSYNTIIKEEYFIINVRKNLSLEGRAVAKFREQIYNNTNKHETGIKNN